MRMRVAHNERNPMLATRRPVFDRGIIRRSKNALHECISTEETAAHFQDHEDAIDVREGNSDLKILSCVRIDDAHHTP